MIIRHAKKEDYGEILDIEMVNFLREEAASPEAMKERLAIIPDTFLVAELDHRVVGYIVGPVIDKRYLTDDLFETIKPNSGQSGFIAVQSLSVAPNYQGQGIGTALLAALKDLALAQGREGISLTCRAELISYYELNGFSDEGESSSQHGGQIWYNLVWEYR
ncbi:GNAT family N-acetyltransferase [Streptococcus dentapri]|uniref:GNAT family N-acetyltransferase n=1 Tax=Streptococcus dentapri TaxID=573564 RepID=A0ABV8D0M4_9STRE